MVPLSTSVQMVCKCTCMCGSVHDFRCVVASYYYWKWLPELPSLHAFLNRNLGVGVLFSTWEANWGLTLSLTRCVQLICFPSFCVKYIRVSYGANCSSRIPYPRALVWLWANEFDQQFRVVLIKCGTSYKINIPAVLTVWISGVVCHVQKNFLLDDAPSQVITITLHPHSSRFFTASPASGNIWSAVAPSEGKWA